MANIQELLMLRTEFEEITESFNMTTHGSSINIIEWFTENGHRSNSLRPGYGRAKEIADILWGAGGRVRRTCLLNPIVAS